MVRVGHGFDVHRFVSDKKLIIGGVYIPFFFGLDAHSDGDVMIHAIIDALLGAAGLGDIGRLFSDGDPQFNNIDSRKLLCDVRQRIFIKGYQVSNIDITLIAQMPLISPYVFDMCTNVSHDLECSIDCVNIKSTTTERLGVIGNGEGIACEVVSLLI